MLFLLLNVSGGKGFAQDLLVLTQTPLSSTNASAPIDLLDLRYPPGTRVVMVRPSKYLGTLSEGLYSAGGPVISWDARRIFFVGKANAAAAWQIYETAPEGGMHKAITAMRQGAMSPALLPNGDVVFSSPVPRINEMFNPASPAALYVQPPGEAPKRLTYGPKTAVEPTVLADGRILFVSVLTSADTNAPVSMGLYTINNDGTEVTRFALDRDGAPFVYRPRELGNGLLTFIADAKIEMVRMARPFQSRAPLFPFATSECRSIESLGAGFLICCEPRDTASPAKGSWGCYQVATNAVSLGKPIYLDPAWNVIEAVPLAPSPKPMGHLSAMSSSKKTGNLLCMDANFHRDRRIPKGQLPSAVRVRVSAAGTVGVRLLGEMPLEADGSFLVEVPADTPIGFETLDRDGKIVYQQQPSLWVRPGENRSCVGCHEPYNRSPRNYRPIAGNKPPVRLGGGKRP